ncbi:Cadmium/zinc-transporting ATPase HMA2 (Cadmium/zinc-transporting ATPase 3) (Protein HEAVY METAL ATPASE 2) [Durusdinium trenchii]|uniref:Cadmium/zinc-transporting ATPase HMA2 (Cadmium/zinc-transporting ATPase 3) (Protein HEAVY METAL ATPASE 2) n=1 Tax=Durusdinium trenchii TaxID=1381693 RepID=A0ABP0KZ52_9DINO
MLAKRISMHVLMFLVLLGSLYLQQFTEAATVAFLVNASEWIVGKSQQAVERELGKSLVGTASHATVLTPAPERSQRSVLIEELKPKDVVLLKTGNTVPTDGVLLKAQGFTVNEASVTGEALPVEKFKGEKLLSGTVVTAGVAEMECTSSAKESFQGKIQAAVQDARSSRSEMEDLVNRFAEIYTPVVVLLSLALALWSSDLTQGLTVLVSACPCAVMAAAPVVQSCAFVRLLSDLQVLVKDARALDCFAHVERLGTDKTGTLTKGSFELADVVVMPGQSERRDLLKLLAALESQDSHPLANSLVRSYVGCAATFAESSAKGVQVERFTRVESQGIWGIIDGQVIGAGSRRFLDSMAIDVPKEGEAKVKEWEQQGGVSTIVYMTVEDDVAMILRLEDELREDAKAAIATLQTLGVYVAMLTGDERKAAEAVGAALGISERRSKLTPGDKETLGTSPVGRQSVAWNSPNFPQAVKATCMLGDGLNDGPALAAADLGVAIASGLQLPCDAADVVIGSGGQMLQRFVQALHFAKKCKERERAILVKLTALTLAFTGVLAILEFTQFSLWPQRGFQVMLNSLRPLTWGFLQMEASTADRERQWHEDRLTRAQETDLRLLAEKPTEPGRRQGRVAGSKKELVDEVSRLNKEANDIQQDNNVYASLEKRYDSLVKTVRSLEGDLADHNLATDKQRTDTRPEEVHHMYTIMKSQNEQQRADVDQIFLEKRSHEEEIGRMEQEITAIARQAEERLNELHPDQRREYDDLREESKRLSADLAEARDDLDQVTGRLNALEGKLRSDPWRQRHRQLNQTRRDLETQVNQLREEVQQGSMSIPEQREILLSKVKNDNAEIVATEKSNSEQKLDNERLRAQIREVIADVEEKKEENSDQQKYEILFTKDQEMTAFIEGFAEAKAEEERKIQEKKESIERLQLIISKSVELPPDVTPESHLRDMEDELDFKKAQLQNSETTQSRLEAELAKREGELEKIESLDVKISLELSQVEEKMRQYEKEITERYDRIEEMKAQGAFEAQRLEGSKKGLEERSQALRQQVNFIRLRYDGKRQQLQDDETAAALEAQEQRIRQFGQTFYTLRSFILQKTSESDFRGEMAYCLEIAAQLNKMLQEGAVPRPPGV